jgi:hypothetical protein
VAEELDGRLGVRKVGMPAFEELAAFADLLFTHPAGEQRLVGAALDLDDLLGDLGGRAHGLRAAW